MTPSTLLHPLKLDVVDFQEDEHDYREPTHAVLPHASLIPEIADCRLLGR